jgi:hypothetical protein
VTNSLPVDVYRAMRCAEPGFFPNLAATLRESVAAVILDDQGLAHVTAEALSVHDAVPVNRDICSTSGPFTS